MTTVSFPGIGIDEFTMNEVALAFRLFGKQIEVRWYGILITVGIMLAIIYAARRARDEGIILDDLLDMGIFAIIAGVVGARIYYVLTYGISNFVVKEGVGEAAVVNVWKTFVSLIGIWNGGIAIYGAIIGGALAVWLVCRKKKIKPQKALDAIGPGVMIGQILGRWGNFVNGEAYGYEVTEGSLLYTLRMGVLPNIESSSVMHYFHPTFLYESLWNLIGFIIINLLYKKKKFDGQVFLMYITWYGFGRMFIEGLRTDSLYVGVFRVSQVVGFCCFLIGGGLLLRGFILAKKAAYERMDYEPVYPGFKKRVTENKNDAVGGVKASGNLGESANEDQQNLTEEIDKTEDKSSGDDN